MSEAGDSESPSVEDDVDPSEALLEELKKQKRTIKMQLTKLYSRLVRLMSEETVDREAILIALETVEEKKLDAIQILEDLIVIYEWSDDKKNVERSNDEIDKIIEATDKEIATVKGFLSSFSRKSLPKSEPKKHVELKRKEQEEMSPLENNLSQPKSSQPFSSQQNSSAAADRKLERIKLLTFSGDKTKFEYFWAAFESIVDDSQEPARYKMLRLKACLHRKAEESIAKLGFSEEAYEEAKNTLKRRFGDERGQLQNYLEEVKRIKPIQEGNVQDLEKFADTLVSTIVTLREHSRWSELQPGSLLFTVVLEKIPKTMLSRFYRWAKESGRQESIETLRDWITEESEYQMKAVETIERLHGAKGKPKEEDRKRSNRTFTGIKQKCDVCQGNHAVRNCQSYKAMSVDDRWKVAKEKKLCFRCLANNHQGKDCKRAKECGVNGCKRNHDRLLHQLEESQARDETVAEESANPITPPTRVFATVTSEETDLSNSEQAIEEHSLITTLASSSEQNLENVSL